MISGGILHTSNGKNTSIRRITLADVDSKKLSYDSKKLKYKKTPRLRTEVSDDEVSDNDNSFEGSNIKLELCEENKSEDSQRSFNKIEYSQVDEDFEKFLGGMSND